MGERRAQDTAVILGREQSRLADEAEAASTAAARAAAVLQAHTGAPRGPSARAADGRSACMRCRRGLEGGPARKQGRGTSWPSYSVRCARRALLGRKSKDGGGVRAVFVSPLSSVDDMLCGCRRPCTAAGAAAAARRAAQRAAGGGVRAGAGRARPTLRLCNPHPGTGGARQEVARGQALGAHASTELAELAAVYGALARGYREEYVMYNLPAAALAQARRPPRLAALAPRRGAPRAAVPGRPAAVLAGAWLTGALYVGGHFICHCTR